MVNSPEPLTIDLICAHASPCGCWLHLSAVIIFTEALTHGTLPWTMPYDRRSVLYRYSPANSAYAGGRHDMDSDHRAGPAWPLAWYDGLTDAQRAVLEPPYHPRHQRPILGDDGCVYTRCSVADRSMWFMLTLLCCSPMPTEIC